MSRKCFLSCLLNSHPPIPLFNEVEVIVGRSKATRIKSQACSRQQLSLKANCEDCIVELKQLGHNPSGLDGFVIKKNTVYKVGHGTRVEILLNNFIHTIEFDPPPDGIENVIRKRKNLADELDDSSKKKIKMENNSIKSEIFEANKDVWDEIDNGQLYVFTSKGVKPSNKIAAFDMDGTLIKTKSGKVHPVDTDDWQIAFPCVVEKVEEYFSLDYKLVILSNQAPIGNGRVKIEDFKKKIENVVTKLQVPIQAFIATGKGFYRKPTTGMWDVLVEQKNDGIPVDISNSFYCGDAAGRLANWAPGKKKDHSMADKLLAENLGLKFYTPEQFFLGHSITNVPMTKPEFNPKELKTVPFNENLISEEKEILVLVGFPGSGKSYVAKEIEKKSNDKYITVCRDVLGSWQKCAAEATKFLKQGKSVIVDSTNPDIESRARWTSLARDMNVPCRCAKMATTIAHARHNNKFRELMKFNHLPVNDMVFHAYKNKFTEPKLTEGFKEVIEVKFSGSFKDKQAETLYKMHLLEK